jgi:hypothetical protein
VSRIYSKYLIHHLVIGLRNFELLGPTGDILEEWLIRDCVIKERFTTLDYSDDVFTKLVISQV